MERVSLSPRLVIVYTPLQPGCSFSSLSSCGMRAPAERPLVYLGKRPSGCCQTKVRKETVTGWTCVWLPQAFLCRKAFTKEVCSSRPRWMKAVSLWTTGNQRKRLYRWPVWPLAHKFAEYQSHNSLALLPQRRKVSLIHFLSDTQQTQGWSLCPRNKFTVMECLWQHLPSHSRYGIV